MTAAAPPSTDLKTALEEMRKSVAARGVRRGLAGKIQEAILGILSVLMAILEDFRAGRLAPLAPVAEAAAGDADACPSPRPAGSCPVATPHSSARGEGEVRARTGSVGADFVNENTPTPTAAHRVERGVKPLFPRVAGEEVTGFGEETDRAPESARPEAGRLSSRRACALPCKRDGDARPASAGLSRHNVACTVRRLRAISKNRVFGRILFL
jgi:hypothetical protein